MSQKQKERESEDRKKKKSHAVKEVLCFCGTNCVVLANGYITYITYNFNVRESRKGNIAKISIMLHYSHHDTLFCCTSIPTLLQGWFINTLFDFLCTICLWLRTTIVAIIFTHLVFSNDYNYNEKLSRVATEWSTFMQHIRKHYQTPSSLYKYF